MSNVRDFYDPAAAFTARRKTVPEIMFDDDTIVERAAPLADVEPPSVFSEPPIADTVTPAVDPQTRSVASGASNFIGKMVEPLRLWVMSGKSPFAGHDMQASTEKSDSKFAEAESTSMIIENHSEPPANKKMDLLSATIEFVTGRPILTGGVVTAIIIMFGVLRGHDAVNIEMTPSNVGQGVTALPSLPVTPSRVTAPATLAATPVAMQEETQKALDEIRHRLKNVESEQQRLGSVDGRIANIEATTQSLRSQIEADPSSRADIEALRQGLDEVRGVTASLAEHMDERLSKMGWVSVLPGPSHVRRAPMTRERNHAPRSTPVDSSSIGRATHGSATHGSATHGSATLGSATHGFVLTTSDKIDVEPGDMLPGYGHVDSVRLTKGGKMVITESGTIFVKTGGKRGGDGAIR